MDILIPHAGEAALKQPADELAAATDRALAERDLFRQAARSALYGPRWRRAGIRPEWLRGRAGLRCLPFIDGGDLIAMTETGAGLRRALLARPRTWVATRGAPGRAKKWLPLTLADTARWLARAQRVLDVLAAADGGAPALALVMNEAMPAVSNALPYLWERADYLAGPRRFELIIVATSMLWRNHWDRFALQKQPGWLAGSVADARFLAAELAGRAPDLIAPPGRGLFWGEPLDGPGAGEGQAGSARRELEQTYGLAETFSLYLSAECRELYVECAAHAGLHLWLDGAIHEILPDGAAPGEAVFVEEAPAGTEGEYAVTTLHEALPLVRYRTGDRLRVVGSGPCACGITHPRVRFLGRVERQAAP